MRVVFAPRATMASYDENVFPNRHLAPSKNFLLPDFADLMIASIAKSWEPTRGEYKNGLSGLKEGRNPLFKKLFNIIF